jgi:hypothetical protein
MRNFARGEIFESQNLLIWDVEDVASRNSPKYGKKLSILIAI